MILCVFVSGIVVSFCLLNESLFENLNRLMMCRGRWLDGVVVVIVLLILML